MHHYEYFGPAAAGLANPGGRVHRTTIISLYSGLHNSDPMMGTTTHQLVVELLYY
jgi:hypothetical protein